MSGPTIRLSREVRRGCGYRQPGGLYLVSGPPTEPCAALPVPVPPCPCCGRAIKPARGWTWVDPALLLGLPVGPHGSDEHYQLCPLSYRGGLGERAGLLWVGSVYYPTPAAFTEEAQRLGVSRRIPALPRGLVQGTWILLGHRKACHYNGPAPEWYGPGVFLVFRFHAVEYIVRGDETERQLHELERRGVQLVRVVPITADGTEVHPAL